MLPTAVTKRTVIPKICNNKGSSMKRPQTVEGLGILAAVSGILAAVDVHELHH